MSRDAAARWFGLSPGALAAIAREGAWPGEVIDPEAVSAALVARARGDPEVPGLHPALLDASRIVARGGRPDEVYDHVLSALVRALDAAGAALFGRSDDGAFLRASVGAPVPGHSGGAVHWCLSTGRSLNIPDPRALSGSVEATDDPCHALMVPLEAAGFVVGVVVVLRFHPQPPFGPGHLAAVAPIAVQAALMLERTEAHASYEGRLANSQSQLEAYALDLRQTFAAEKARTRELLSALEELERTYLATVRGLAVAVEAKDEYTGGHLVRVSGYAGLILDRVDSMLSKDPVFLYGFLLHDVGKLGIPDRILTKQGPLDDDEWMLMRTHPEIGRRIIDGISFLEQATDIVYAHHERWDGSGYPRGLRGEEIQVGARVFAVADAFDAMTTTRPYRRALMVEDALAELESKSGSQLWPAAVEAFLSIPRDDLSVVGGAYGRGVAEHVRRPSREAG